MWCAAAAWLVGWLAVRGGWRRIAAAHAPSTPPPQNTPSPRRRHPPHASRQRHGAGPGRDRDAADALLLLLLVWQDLHGLRRRPLRRALRLFVARELRLLRPDLPDERLGQQRDHDRHHVRALRRAVLGCVRVAWTNESTTARNSTAHASFLTYDYTQQQAGPP